MFNKSFEKDSKFQKNAYETLDDDEYDKFVEESFLRKKNDFNKYNKSFEKQNDFWRNASVSIDEDNFEKLLEEECLVEPFVEVPEMDNDFEPYMNLFKKGDLFWNLGRKNLKDVEYEMQLRISFFFLFLDPYQIFYLLAVAKYCIVYDYHFHVDQTDSRWSQCKVWD